jgi:aminomethyltransferase
VGVRCDARAVPREGYPLLLDDEEIGAVTSGNFSPTLGVGIALALADAARVPPPDTAVAIGGRRRSIPGTIVKPPFVTPGSR